MILRLPSQFWQLSNIVGIARNQENNFSEHLEHFGKLPKKIFGGGKWPKMKNNHILGHLHNSLHVHIGENTFFNTFRGYFAS